MEQNQAFLQRTEAILGKNSVDKLQRVHVVVLGLGGVGSFCATSLARVGIGKLTLVDFDTIDTTNINRQEFALHSTVGMKKIDVAKKLIKDINPDIKLNLLDKKIDENNVSNICSDCDFIVDAIDDIPAKIAVARFAEQSNINEICCLGTALRLHPEKLKYADLYKTSVCPLAKQMRKEAKKAGIKNLTVVFSEENPVKTTDKVLGSVSYVPPVAGHMLTAYAVNTLVQDI